MWLSDAELRRTGHPNLRQDRCRSICRRVVRTEEISAQCCLPDATSSSGAAAMSLLWDPTPCESSCYLTPQVSRLHRRRHTEFLPSSHTNALPSFNVFRLMPRTTCGLFPRDVAAGHRLMRNYVDQFALPQCHAGSPYVIYNSPTAAHTAANVVGYNWVFSSTAGNAGLLPESADQFDLSFERYFNATSSLTLGLFYKKLTNSLSYANFDRDFTNNGATETTQVRGPINEKDGGRLKGVEAAYQTFFDFLPNPFNGLGVQLNYTYVGQSGIQNSNLIDATSGGGVGAVGAGVPVVTSVVIDSHSLAGVSQNTFNLVGLYEKGPWAALSCQTGAAISTANSLLYWLAGVSEGRFLTARCFVGSHVELSLMWLLSSTPKTVSTADVRRSRRRPAQRRCFATQAGR